jgi:hypothetical protein
MKKARVLFHSAVAFGAGLCSLPALSSAQTTFLGAGGQGINPTAATPIPNRSNGNGGQFGNNSDIIQSVVVTTGYENIQSASTTPPANAVSAPAIFFQINLYSPAANPTNIEVNTGSGYYEDYDLMLETVPGGGLVSTPTTVTNPFSAPFGISTGENYFVNGYNTQTGATSTVGGNAIYNYNSGAWAVVAGSGQSPYVATTTTITPTSITYGIPLVDLGLNIGNNFTFDAYSTFGNPGGQSAYDDLDDPNFAPAGYYPYSNGAGTPTPFDSATAGGSLASYTVATPTLTWNDAGAATGFADGMTWDSNDTNNFNWNNGMFADYYVDGANVIFNDNIGGTSVRTITLNTTVSPGSITVNSSAGNYSISGTGSIVGGGPLTKSGTDTLTINTKGTAVGAVSVTGGVLQLGTSTGLATMTSLSIGANSTFDINNNHVIIDYGSGPDPISSIAALLKTGYNSGKWNGLGGIISTAAQLNNATPGNLLYGVGYADSADHGNPAGLSSGTIEIKYTLLGDANLSGVVDGTDFGIVAANFNKGVTGWDQGDFNYNNVVDGTDFGFLAANFNKGASGASVGGPAWTDPALVAFAQANGLMADVPEPASFILATSACIGLLRRTRRRSN